MSSHLGTGARGGRSRGWVHVWMVRNGNALDEHGARDGQGGAAGRGGGSKA